MALNRFISRRGHPQEIFSDNGTNFVGGKRELQEMSDFFIHLNTDTQAKQYALENHIQWNFNPPSAPHFGALWESNIRCMKGLIKRTCIDLKFSHEEFETLLFKVESILNSRPLYPLSDSLDDLEFLTPGHFLIGGPLTAIPEHNLTELPLNRLSRWQLIQNRTQVLWNKWSKEYLHSLQQRRKWFTANHQPHVGQLVLICEVSNPLHWRRGRIIKLYPGTDNLTRVVLVKTPSGEFKRPLSKLAPLLADNFN